MENNVKIIKSFVVLRGEVMFSNLKTPKSFEKAPDKKFFDITLKIKAENVEEVASAFDHLNDKAWDSKTQDLKPHQTKNLAKAPPKYRDIIDKERDEPTGEISITFTRPESMEAPQITDKEGKILDRKFLPRGSEVLVSASFYEYNTAGKIGVSFTLDKIRVEHEAAGAGRRPGYDEVEEFFKAVNEDELVF